MYTPKMLGRMVGVLFIIGTVAGIMSYAVTGDIFDQSKYLTELAAHENDATLGALLVAVMALALALVPVFAFPVLRRVDEQLARGYLLFRGALEVFGYFVTFLVWLFLLSLSKDYVAAGAVDSTPYTIVGDAALELVDWAAALMTIVFTLGAMMYYAALFRGRLVPRWLAGWGFLGAFPYLLGALLVLFGTAKSVDGTIMALDAPLGIQEMVMALWLLWKGYDVTWLEGAGKAVA